MTREEIIKQIFDGKCDAEEEWENFQPVHDLSPDISGKLWNSIDKNTASTKAHHVYFRWMAVAASVLLVVGVSWRFIKQKTTIATIATVAIAKNIVDTSSHKNTLTLSDGSTVELLPNSKLSYPESFPAAKREIILNGEATFNVAKDVAKPFSVYSNSVLITVLGTNFTVKSYGSNKVTKVILHEGRIMVKISDSSFPDNKNEYYLTPGDVFILKKDNTPSARIFHLEKDKDDCYVFNNYPLGVVFDQLQIIYNTKIIYNKAEPGNRTFIGKIDKKDSLSHILTSISVLNNFGLHKQGDSFVINREGSREASPY